MLPFSVYYVMEMQINGEQLMNMVNLEERLIEWDITESKYFYLPKLSHTIRRVKKCLE